ncbi:MAG: patatin-like phospholipase family protein [Oscillochloridaceae bacterium umkhey_bin13]
MSSPAKPRRVAIACQGGGSHTAFTAGALKALLRHAETSGYQICALSGTSGGAICAALAWYGLIRQARGEWSHEQVLATIDGFWRDNAALLPWERVWNDWTVSLIRLHAQGRLPTLNSSPYTPQAVYANELLKQLSPRPEFFDLRALLAKYLDLDSIPQAVSDPRLLIGAVGVLSGSFKAFDSFKAEISLDAILASTTLPTLFQAIRIGDDVYWDGLFSQNPPVRQLVVGIDRELKPDEIWVVRINRQTITSEPTSVEEIEDRRNALAGNLSLNHELDVINKINTWLLEGAIQVPHLKPITIRQFGMSDELNARLGYVSKLNRDPDFLDQLMRDGEAQAETFVSGLSTPIIPI